MSWYVWRLWILAFGCQAGRAGDSIEDGLGVWRPLAWRLWVRNGSRLHAGLEWRPEDLWVGAYWRRSWEYAPGFLQANHQKLCMRVGLSPEEVGMVPVLEVWLCLLPCLPLHVLWRGEARATPELAGPAEDACCSAGEEVPSDG